MQIERRELAAFLDSALGVLPEEHRVGNRPYWDHYNIASYILIQTFGLEWVESNVHPMDRPTRYFGKSRSHEEHDRFRARVCQLAELVHNLDRVENFDNQVQAVKNARKDGVEAAIVELIAGGMLKQRGVMFRFVKGVGKKHCDYDIEYVRTDSKVGYCETECKLPATTFSNKTVTHTLKHAKGQLPKGESGIIALRTPQEWHPSGDQSTWKNLEQAINAFFEAEKTTRVSAVVGFTDIISPLNDTTMEIFLVARDYPNRFCQDPTGLPPWVINGQPANGEWVSLAAELATTEPHRRTANRATGTLP